MFVITALAATALAIVGVATPHVASANLNRNESAAIATLKNISSGQAQIQASGAIDENGNGQGEYGFFAEMAGAVVPRGRTDPVDPPVLSARFGELVSGRVTHSGYVFQVFLPGLDDLWVPEAAGGGAPRGGVDPSLSEVLWCCYAWPVEPSVTGNRAFMINQSGDVLACNQAFEQYGGGVAPPAGLAAFQPGGLSAGVAANTVDVRGNIWVVV